MAQYRLHSEEHQTNVKLWSGNFWMICLANLLVSISQYMLIPTLPIRLLMQFDLKVWQAGGIVALSGFSVFLIGPFFNYLVDRFRRRNVCLIAVLLVVLSIAGYYWASTVAMIIFLRVVQGIAQGAALMAGGSTLAIDLTQSPRRTDANNAFAWFGRLGLSLGPLGGLLLMRHFDFEMVVMVAVLFGLAGAVCIWMLNVPFRAPLYPSVCSLDRFWLPNGRLMFFQVLLIAVGAGLLLAVIHWYEFYACLMVGFCLSLLALQVIFQEADIRSEMVCGMILWVGGLLLLIFHHEAASFYASGILVGLGIGLSAARLLIFYVRLSHHCERGSANTSYLLAWELGLSVGFFIGYSGVVVGIGAFWIGISLLVFSLLFYLLIVHRWYMSHKVR